jgi:hypothetical protein
MFVSSVMKRLLWSGFAAVLVGTGLLLAACNGTVNPPIVVPSTALPIPTVPTKEQVLQRFGSNHPRLFVTAADFATVKNRIGSDTTLSSWYGASSRSQSRAT